MRNVLVTRAKCRSVEVLTSRTQASMMARSVQASMMAAPVQASMMSGPKKPGLTERRME